MQFGQTRRNPRWAKGRAENATQTGCECLPTPRFGHLTPISQLKRFVISFTFHAVIYFGMSSGLVSLRRRFSLGLVKSGCLVPTPMVYPVLAVVEHRNIEYSPDSFN
jgi:hypothetical protein